MDNEERINQIVKKYNLDLESLKSEQIKLSKGIVIKDKIDFKLADKFGAINSVFINNKILCSIIVCDKEWKIIDKTYVFEKIRFPYIPGFRNYREVPTMILAYEKLKEIPDLFFISGQGITHQRLGIASHFSLSTGIPTIGISNSVLDCEIDGENIKKNKKIVGKVYISREGSRPIYISPGNLISVETAFEIVKKFIVYPHKFPEPMHLASKYSREIQKEILENI